jgi:hypothetical protein
MQLTVLDRFLLMGALPATGDFATIKIVRLLREKVSFRESEHDDYKIITNADGTVSWDTNQEKFVEMDFTPMETKLVVEAMKKLDEEKKLTVQHVPLWEKVFPEEAKVS